MLRVHPYELLAEDMVHNLRVSSVCAEGVVDHCQRDTRHTLCHLVDGQVQMACVHAVNEVRAQALAVAGSAGIRAFHQHLDPNVAEQLSGDAVFLVVVVGLRGEEPAWCYRI